MKQTFLNLAPEKQQVILEGFLREFVAHDYAQASLSRVVRELGIAKGSVYQYFGDKLALHRSLEQVCQAEKMGYIHRLSRDDFPDFWAYFREMFRQGMRFDLERPLHSQFLFRMSTDRSHPELAARLEAGQRQAIGIFTALFQAEQANGHLSKDFDPEFVARTVVVQSQGIRDYLDQTGSIDYERNLRETNTIFALEEEAIMAYVDQSILLFRRAFHPQFQP